MRAPGLLAALAAALISTEVPAQMDQAIPAGALVDPWIAAKAVVVTLPELFDHVAKAEQRSALDRKLGELDDRLAELVSRQEAVAVSIASNPSFVYNAPASSDRMSAQVSEIQQAFDALFGDLTVRERADVRTAQASLDALRRLLSDKNALEHDVINAVASGSRNQIQALAGRWWDGAESVRDVREALAQVRGRLAAAQPTRGDPARGTVKDGERWAQQFGQDLAALEKVSGLWSGGGALEIDAVSRSAEAFEFNVTRCKYAELFQELGLPELGALFHCSRDFAMAEGFNRDMTLTRTQTIMQGASHCDFRFRVKA